MRVMIAFEGRHTRTRNGHIYSAGSSDYNLWKRYLQVFDEVMILTRVKDSAEDSVDKVPSDGPGVKFVCLPYYIGAWQYARKHFELISKIRNATSCADAFILRIPGRIPTLLWHQLMAEKIPYGVEVVGSSADVAKTGGFNILLRGVCKLLRKQKEICANASVASYVTKNYLQKQYPSSCWSTSCPNVDLPEETIASDTEEKFRIQSIKEAVRGHRPIRICHVGTMGNLYKAQDVLLEAGSICLNRGLNVELTLLGDGRCRNYFENKARTLGLTEYVSFLGQLPPGQAVRRQLDKTDIFVMPSLTEGLPRILLEAMARGLPCIGSNVGGIPELLEPEYLVPPGDSKSLARKICEVARDSELLERMSRRNLEESKKYRITMLNQRRIEFYKKVAELAKGRTSPASKNNK